METLLDPLASPYNLAVLAAIAVLVAAALVMIAHGKREGNYGSERFSRATQTPVSSTATQAAATATEARRCALLSTRPFPPAT